MTTIKALSAVSLAALLVLAGLTVFGAEGTVTDQQPDQTGTIIDVHRDNQDIRILLEGDKPMSSGEPWLAWVAIDDDTHIVWMDSERTAHKGDLEEGVRIEVWFEGPLLTSYPAQGYAGAIAILKAGS